VKCQVKFFPIKFNPDLEEIKRLQDIQDMITHTHQNIRSEAKNKYDYAVRMQALHKRVRNSWKLLDGIV